MSFPRVVLKSGNQLSSISILIWRIAQTAVWLVGAAILFCLLFYPSLGVLLFWNILIPIAPALFVIAIGVWRNVCPLATTNLLPRHFGLSKRKKLSVTQLGKLNLVGVIALFVIVPLRHAVFNTNGVATAILIISMAFIGIILGFFYEWKSAWCSGLCPIHPVEKLYGGNVLAAIPNAHCEQCMNCVIPCPDSTPNIHPNSSTKTIYHKLSGLLIIGGLPGFIWGWFHVQDETAITSLQSFINVYRLPLIGFIVTLLLFGILSKIIQPKYERGLISIFAASGVSCYYWYRLPALFGFGNYADDGLLVNLLGILPEWSLTAMTITTTLFFFYWLVIRKQNNKSWVIRPQFANKQDVVEERLPEVG
ncbi:MAG: hypothetical protein Q8L07_12730 [Sediminibacterium sp.]|nr:hypothetical protein [Sediminibacterium sp.]MDP3666096.1 hypothetical protein [Sediminibacterium sp.]